MHRVCGKKERRITFAIRLTLLSDSNRIQTYNLLIRSQMLYSVELWSRCFLNCDAKVLLFFESASAVLYFFQKNVFFHFFLPLLLLWGLYKCAFGRFFIAR